MMKRVFPGFGLLLPFVHAALWSGQVWAAPLNDTGQALCYDSKGAVADCAAWAGDGRYGRDAAASRKKTSKKGNGKSGFDFTKIGNDGSELPIDAQLGSKPADWACTRDNVTNLIWEVKTTSPTDLRYEGNRYSWFSKSVAGKDGEPYWGVKADNDTCNKALTDGFCNTRAYVAAVNSVKLCGSSNWRLPKLPELQSLVDYGVKKSPTIDFDFFPNTYSGWHWVQDLYELDPEGAAWDVHFGNGVIGVGNMSASYAVRVVRSAD